MFVRRRFLLPCIILFASLLGNSVFGDGVPREQCFPVERLDPAVRVKAEELLLKMLDREALYTLIGGVKPVSGSFWSTQIKLDEPDVASMEEARQALAAITCGDEYEAGLLVFEATPGNSRTAHAWVAHKPSVRRMLSEHQAFFAPYGVSPSTPPTELIVKMEHAPRADRLRASGYFYGYPDHAVDFFIEAETSRTESEENTHVARDFISAPTFSADKGQFVWAVPKGHETNEADRDLLARAEPILAEYRRRRDLYIGEGKPGVVSLLRDWFDDGYGRCAPENARLDGFSNVPFPIPVGVGYVDASTLIPASQTVGHDGVLLPTPTIESFWQPEPTYVPRQGLFQRWRLGGFRPVR